MNTVAVAVNISGNGRGRGNGSRRAVRWALENLSPPAHHFVLVHVIPVITHIPTPTGEGIPIKELDTHIVSKYMEDIREKAQEIFVQYKRLCKPVEVEFETVLLEYDNVAAALIDYISKSGIRSLVMGSDFSRFWSKIKGSGIPQMVLKCAPNTCDIFVVSKQRVKSKLASSLTSSVTILTDKKTPIDSKIHVVLASGQTPLHSHSTDPSTGLSSWSAASRSSEPSTGLSSWSAASRSSEPSTGLSSWSEPSNSSSDTQVGSKVDDDYNVRAFYNSSMTSSNTHVSSKQISTSETHVSNRQFDLHNEAEQLRLEFDATRALYNRACKDLVHAQKKVEILSSECVEEAEKINAATEREQTLRRIAEQEKFKHLEAVKEVKVAKNLLAKESYARQKAELNALKESDARQEIFDAIISNERGTRKYTPDEIKMATDFFSENKVIGEGSYGKVYKGILDHTPVAIKVLQEDTTDKKEEFLREVGILSQLRHPNIVLLVGVCSEMGALVYEYMENGSLEEHIFRRNGRAPLPWFARFRIAFEIACGLAFLHSKRPEPIVHRDLKPGNILLGRNYVTKISDVGLAKILSDKVPDSVTMFGHSLLAGTLYYIDPEYQRTGTVRSKSDLYSFGMILLQLLTARHPNGLLMVMENAVASRSLEYILDNSIKDWPLSEAEELTKLALECCKLRCRDRPDLEKGVLPVLAKLADVADAHMKVERNSNFAPSHYFCPLLHEIMDEPYIAADGFTYERRAIEAWLEKNDMSPVTKHKLDHFNLTPNVTLLTAIQEWRSHLASKRA